MSRLLLKSAWISGKATWLAKIHLRHELEENGQVIEADILWTRY